MQVLIVIAHPNPRSFCHALSDQLTRGLMEARHEFEVVDLYELGFDPVYRNDDFTFFADDTVPLDVLDRLRLKERILTSCGGFLRRMFTRIKLRKKSLLELVDYMAKYRPQDVVAQQEKLRAADALVIVAPLYWLGFPAILKGWIDRVFTYGFAYALTPQGWQGDVNGRVPLLDLEKVLIMNTTFFDAEDHSGEITDAINITTDQWCFAFPGAKQVDHQYFYSTASVDDKTRETYLDRAYRLGRGLLGRDPRVLQS